MCVLVQARGPRGSHQQDCREGKPHARQEMTSDETDHQANAEEEKGGLAQALHRAVAQHAAWARARPAKLLLVFCVLIAIIWECVCRSRPLEPQGGMHICPRTYINTQRDHHRGSVRYALCECRSCNPCP